MNTRYATILLFAVSCSTTTDTEHRKCNKIGNDPCSCRTPSGWQYSLWPLDNLTGPAFRTSDSQYYYDYNPCSPIAKGICIDALICQRHKRSIYSQFNLGTVDTFQPQIVGNSLEFHYTGFGYRSAIIILQCDHNATTPKLSNFTETKQSSFRSLYTATLTSIHACPVKMNYTCPTMKPTTEPRPTTQPTTKLSTKSPSPPIDPCRPCATYGKELVLAIIVLLLIQLVLYIVIGFAWYRKFYARHVGTYDQKSFKKLDRPIEDDNRCPNY